MQVKIVNSINTYIYVHNPTNLHLTKLKLSCLSIIILMYMKNEIMVGGVLVVL